MKRIRIFGVLLLLFALLLPGCSTEALMERGVEMLDKMFAGDTAGTKTAADPEPAPPAEPEASPSEPEEPGFPQSEEPVIPSPAPSDVEGAAPEEPSSPPSADITPSHTDVTFFGPGETFTYLPKGVEGIYACDYASEDDSIAAVDPATGKVTAVGPGTTNITMHLEYNGQYDFKCIVRCSWKEEAQPASPSADDEPVLPPATAGESVSASHSDATFFNPKEHFQLLPVGAGDDSVCTYAASDPDIATVDENGVVTAVGPGTSTVSMTVDVGGTEYTFTCIVRCNWS